MKAIYVILLLIVLSTTVYAIRTPIIPPIPGIIEESVNFTEVDPIANPRIDWLNMTLFTYFPNYTFLSTNYFNKTEVNSTGLVGLTCADGQIAEMQSGVWTCGTDSGGLSSIYSGDYYTYITGGDTVNVNTTRFNQEYAMLNGSNQPFTGNISVYVASPEIKIENAAGYTRIAKPSGEHTTTRYNQVIEPSGASYSDSDTSYANTGGTGDRRSAIAVTTNLGWGGAFGNDPNTLVDGNTVSDYGTVYYPQAFVGASGKYFQFYFNGASKGITEVKWYQGSTESHGIWKWQGSDNGIDWTDIGSNFTWGGSTTSTITTMGNNTAFYVYYRLLGLSGTFHPAGITFFKEFEFKIFDGSGTEREVQIWKSEDGDGAGTYGITTFGDENTKSVFQGRHNNFTANVTVPNITINKIGNNFYCNNGTDIIIGNYSGYAGC